ncbi:MAG: hypothetical protein ACFE9R_03885, partial [Candidatus Hermodarchaeota archaeon]
MMSRFKVKGIINVISSLVTTMCFPTIIYLNLVVLSKRATIDIDNYFMRLQRIFFIVIFIGFLITSLTIAAYFQRPYSFTRFVFSIMSLVFYCFHVCIWSGTVNFQISFDIISISMNFSYIYMLMIFIPILLI